MSSERSGIIGGWPVGNECIIRNQSLRLWAAPIHGSEEDCQDLNLIPIELSESLWRRIVCVEVMPCKLYIWGAKNPFQLYTVERKDAVGRVERDE